MRLIKKIIILMFLLSVAASIEASGIKVNPSKLETTIKTKETASLKITVSNPTSDVQIFKVYPDEFADIIKINPSSFTLEAGADKTVTVTIKIPSDQKTSEKLNTNLSVIAKPLAETGFQTNAGVKIPLSIAISENSSSSRIPKQAYYALAGVILFGAGALAYLQHKNKLPI